MTAKHHPVLYSTGRQGCWAACTCGTWQSHRWTTTGGAHGEFGQHLLTVNHTTTED